MFRLWLPVAGARVMPAIRVQLESGAGFIAV